MQTAFLIAYKCTKTPLWLKEGDVVSTSVLVWHDSVDGVMTKSKLPHPSRQDYIHITAVF